MSQKRQQEDAKPQTEGCSSVEKRRKIPSLKNVILEVMKLRAVQKFQQFIEPVLEPLIRKVVKEEIDLALRKHLTSMKQNCMKEMHTSDARSLRLQFLDNISRPVFTGSRIEGDECTNLKVALVDALTGRVVFNGPLSSTKVEIVVLEGDFDGNEGDNWTLEEFKNNVVKERKGKKSLITGDAILNLKEGIGLLGEICFTDNSSWTRSRKFRLGARIVDNYDGIRVREAVTESFIVRDHRGELYMKHHPPSLSDEVWRLEKIGKEGAFHKRLSGESVNTVKDFLILLSLDPAKLRTILGPGMSSKMWEVTMAHARTCVLDKKLYSYGDGSQGKACVVFNVVGHVVGLLSHCQYVPTDKLSETEKADAHNLVVSAFEKWEEVVPYDTEASLINSSSCLSNVLYHSKSPMAGSSDVVDINITSFDHSQQLDASPPDIMSSIYPVECSSNGVDNYAISSVETMDARFEHIPCQIDYSLMCEDEHLKYFDTDCSVENQSQESQAANSVLYAHSATVAVDKAQRRWAIVFSVFRWFSIRRIVARKNPC